MRKHRRAYCVRLSPSHVGGRAVISQHFRRHFALKFIIAGSTVEVLLSTCQVSMTNYVCMNFDCRPRPYLFQATHLSMVGVSSVNESSRRVRRATHLRSIVETIHVETHFIHLPTCRYSRPYPYAGLRTSHFCSAPSNINGMINIVRDPCRIHLFH